MALASYIEKVVSALRTSPQNAEHVALSSGFNTLTAPTGADGAVLLPDPTQSATLTLKGVTGDTGLALSTRAPSVVMRAGNIGITASGATKIAVVWFRLQ